VESSCEFCIEPSGSMKCFEILSGPSSSAQLHRVSSLVRMLALYDAYITLQYAILESNNFIYIFTVTLLCM
jgi:hypothetical protein